jgi:Helix-turn-helix domain of transposase family ISL3/Transposase
VAASGLLHRTELTARVPRTHCEEHGILQAAVPWARPGSGFTVMMEAMILLLGQQMSVSAAARHMGESDKRLWRVLEHYVMEAHAAKDWSRVPRLMIGETSARKGHCEAMNGCAPRNNSTCAASWPAPTPILGRAIALRAALQGVLADGPALPSAGGWAGPTVLGSKPFRKLSRTLKEHFHGVLAYLETRLTNAAIEAINGILQMPKRIARGFVTSTTSASPLISRPAVLTSMSLILYPLETSKTLDFDFAMRTCLSIMNAAAAPTNFAH